MRTFRQLRESTAKVAIVTFGRFNPPTIGHEKMINKIQSVARRYGGDAYIFASGSQDAKKNPLPYDDKINIMKKMFPVKGHNVFKYAAKKPPTIMHAASLLFEDGYEEMIMVVGSDRVGQFKKLLPQYNGVDGKPHGFYNFQKITIESAGERDPDADGAEGLSASKMREFAVNSDYDSFSEGLPNTLNDHDKRRMYQMIRKHMRVKVIENILHKQVIDDPIENKNNQVVNFDNIVEYLYQLPYQQHEKIYIDKISDHVDLLIKEHNYFTARSHVNKIKSYINVLDEQSGMVDFSVCDIDIFDKYLDKNYEDKEFILKPINEKLQTIIELGDFEKAALAIGTGMAVKYGYDRLIKTRLSVKAKRDSLNDQIDKLMDKKRSIEDPEKRGALAKKIAKLEDEKAKLNKAMKALAADIEAKKKRKDSGEVKSDDEKESDREASDKENKSEKENNIKARIEDDQDSLNDMRDKYDAIQVPDNASPDGKKQARAKKEVIAKRMSALADKIQKSKDDLDRLKEN